MKLMMYFYSLDRSSGGAERLMLMIAEEMRRRGHDVQLASWDGPEAVTFYPVSPGIHWHKLDAGLGVLGKIHRVTRLARVLRRERPDLFVGFVMGGDKSVYVANMAAGIPFAAAERNSPEIYGIRLSKLASWFYLQLFGLCRGIAVQFESYRRGYPKRLWDRITVLANPVRPASMQAQPGASAGRYTLLSVGRLHDQKRFGVLVDAFHSIAHRFPDWDLRIVGEGAGRAVLEGRVRERGLEGRVFLPGAMADVERAYAEAHLFALASRWEGFPNALAEALAHGLPAVGFAGCPGVNELIVHRSSGLLADGVDDANSLGAALAALMEDAEVRKWMGQEARSSMAAFADDAVYDRWEAFFRRCARASRQEPRDSVPTAGPA